MDGILAEFLCMGCVIWMDYLKGTNNNLCDLGYVLGFSVIILHYLNKIQPSAHGICLVLCVLYCLYLPVKCS